jgi:hypothetical protein
MKTKLLYIGLLFLTFYSCKKDAVPESADYPFVILKDITEISTDGAVFIADITSLGNQEITDYGFVWDDSVSKPTINNYQKSLGIKPNVGEIQYKLKFGLGKGISYKVRAYIKTNKYIVYSNILAFTSQGSNPPRIINFTPEYGSISTIVKILGENFIACPIKNKVKIGNLSANVDSSTENVIYVKIPKILAPDSVKISVEVAKMITISDKYFSLYYPWLKKSNINFITDFISTYFSIQNKGYIINPNSTNIFVYNSEDDSWIDTIKLPENSGNKPIAFSINEKGYLLIQNNFWEYNLSTGMWTKKQNYPGVFTSYIYSFNTDINGYIGDCHNNKELWQYNSNSDEWVKMNNFPGGFQVQDPPWGYFSFTVNNRGYVGINRFGAGEIQFWEYNSVTNIWSNRTEYPSGAYSNWGCFVVGNKAYLGLGFLQTGAAGAVSNKIWEYNPINDSWVNYHDCPKSLAVCASFSINNKGYVLGINTLYDEDNTKYLYQFDPTKN